jgi:hypothetical protein
MELFADRELLPRLAGEDQKRRRVFKGICLITALGLMLFALAGPRWGSHYQEVSQRGVDIMLAVDVSRSMLVEDVVMTIQGSELNRRTRERGDRESVEVPSSDVANEEENSDTSTASTSSEEISEEESSETPSNTQADDAPQGNAATQDDEAQTGSEADNTPVPVTESSSPESASEPAPEQPAPATDLTPTSEPTSEASGAQSD